MPKIKPKDGEAKRFRVSLIVEINGDASPETVVEMVDDMLAVAEDEHDWPLEGRYDCTAEEID